MFAKTEDLLDGLINVAAHTRPFPHIFQEEAMTGGKGIFVPAFVGDIHRAKSFACWLDPQFDMCINGSLYPFGWNQDAFR